MYVWYIYTHLKRICTYATWQKRRSSFELWALRELSKNVTPNGIGCTYTTNVRDKYDSMRDKYDKRARKIRFNARQIRQACETNTIQCETNTTNVQDKHLSQTNVSQTHLKNMSNTVTSLPSPNTFQLPPPLPRPWDKHISNTLSLSPPPFSPLLSIYSPSVSRYVYHFLQIYSFTHTLTRIHIKVRDGRPSSCQIHTQKE